MRKDLKNTIFLIPARKNSKGLPFKNRKLFDITINTIPSEYRNNVYVSTDDDFIKKKCKSYRLNIVDRPDDISTDTSSLKDVILHFIKTLNIENKNIILLFLTYPERTWEDIKNVFDFFIKTNASSVVCGEEISISPYLLLEEKPNMKGKLVLNHSLYRRQDYPKCFKHSMFVSCYKSEICHVINDLLIEENTNYYRIDSKVDVDTKKDLISLKKIVTENTKNIFVDIDETICYYEGERDYNLAKPYNERIKKINSLYEEGKHITYYTARGTVTGIDWSSLTKSQLKKWGCKYHKLSVGEKPDYDLLICDKVINTKDFFN